MATSSNKPTSSGKPLAAMARVFDRIAQDRDLTGDERMQALSRAKSAREKSRALELERSRLAREARYLARMRHLKMRYDLLGSDGDLVGGMDARPRGEIDIDVYAQVLPHLMNGLGKSDPRARPHIEVFTDLAASLVDAGRAGADIIALRPYLECFTADAIRIANEDDEADRHSGGGMRLLIGFDDTDETSPRADIMAEINRLEQILPVSRHEQDYLYENLERLFRFYRNGTEEGGFCPTPRV